MEDAQTLDSRALALKLAEEIDPDKAWNGFQIDCIKRGIEAARAESAQDVAQTTALLLQTLATALQEQAEKFSDPGVRLAFEHSAGRIREMITTLQKPSS